MVFKTSDMQYSTLEDVWGSFPKKSHSMTAKIQHPEEKRDPVKEARIFPTPQHRSAHAVSTHKKRIDDLSGSLPIVNDESEDNWKPEVVPSRREHFTLSKKEPAQHYRPSNWGTDFPYAPQEFQNSAYDLKLEKIMRMIQESQPGKETPATQDMLLYIFTGIFFLFTFDTFVSLGKRMK
jgi:hypothetical protein